MARWRLLRSIGLTDRDQSRQYIYMDGQTLREGHIMLKRIAAVCISLVMLVSPAAATTTKAEVLAACTSSVSSVAATCQTLLLEYIAQVKAAGVNVDATLGALAYELVLSPNLSAATKDLVGGAIATIADNVSDTSLKSSLNSVAGDAKDDGVVASLPTKAYSPGSPSGN